MIVLCILIICIILFGMFCYYKNKEDDIDNSFLLTDMEIYISQLEIRPKSNKTIKKIATYLENTIMPNEKILAVAYVNIYTIVTDKRIIIKGANSSYINIIPIEKITSLTQSDSRIFINQSWVNLLSTNMATKVMNIINNEISKTQTVKSAIKIENKIVTEETIASQLKKLSDLHDAKVLNDFEYSMKKQELLEKMK